MVIVFSSPQFCGTIGSALSGSSVRMRVELAHLAQERLVLLDALAERHARDADVGGIGEDFRHGERAILGVIIVNLEAPGGERAARVEVAS